MIQVNFCNEVDNFYCKNVSFNNTKKTFHSDSLNAILQLSSSRIVVDWVRDKGWSPQAWVFLDLFVSTKPNYILG